MRNIYFGRNVRGNVQQKAGDPLSFHSKIASKPLVTVAPIITGTPAVGEVLTYVAGTWLNFSSVIHEWQVNGQFVQFSGPTYLVDAADVGKSVTVLERATNPNGGASSRSAPMVIA